MTSLIYLIPSLAIASYVLAAEGRAEPTLPSPRMTSMAELLEKFEREVPPAPTSPPTTLEMRLFPRDYSLPSDYCGWNVEQKCHSSDYPQCWTIFMSSRANRDMTYTAVNCYKSNAQNTFYLQDYLPFTSTIDVESTSTEPDTSTVTTTIPPTSTTSSSNPTPVGAIVGGVVGGLAIIALVILGIFFYCRKKPTNMPPVEQIISPTTQPPHQPPHQPSFASPPVYNAQTSNPAWLPASPSPSSPTYNPAGVHYQNMPSTSPQPEQFSNTTPKINKLDD
ncbi:hypothetical protein BKA59DRAFT_492662 [Fusarium tricinctum]|uniref:Mid2 domain-containing protein n=1 Tax=Fusarium tricinctum TaxID=61284 RepID=A0A8K0S4A0_9HYPO|nr:hypothetical protein BKA59DRAFT_492662 [Fusarium tricinctum]